MRHRRRAAVLAAVAVLSLTGCTSFAGSLSAQPRPAGGTVCPAARARPAADRPVVALDFRLADDGRTVTGTETVTFTPDLATAELVFRLVPNGSDSAPAGTRLTVDAVRGFDVRAGRYVAAGAAAPGGLYVVALDRTLRRGRSTEVQLDFTLTLGTGTFDRLGTDGHVSWWASGAPLLAWEPGVGWARDPFVPLLGETADSPAAATTVRVSVPARLTVLMTGNQAAPTPVRNGRRTWTSTEPAARDVSVAAGPFTTAQRTTPDGVRVTTGVLPGSGVGAGTLAGWTTAAIADLGATFGAFPYRTLTVALLPDYGGGIEYPSAILEASPERPVLVHEVAHMWFYGMVGNSQFRDPWLDEAFATYAEALVDPASAARLRPALGVPGAVGAPMSGFSDDRTYFTVVYGKGGAALLAARDAAGPQAFDAALRCYADARAWQIATPADLGEALGGLPKALDVLLRARALDAADLPR
ncbi:MAG: M1 family aminopeptidase [Blastococcus sp.]